MYFEGGGGEIGDWSLGRGNIRVVVFEIFGLFCEEV